MIYGIFETVNDVEFYFEDILAKDENGKFLLFATETQAISHMPKKWETGISYEVKPVELREDYG